MKPRELIRWENGPDTSTTAAYRFVAHPVGMVLEVLRKDAMGASRWDELTLSGATVYQAAMDALALALCHGTATINPPEETS